MSIRVSFHGAAGSVTGSKFLVEYQDRKILIDCGLFQGKKELRLRNWRQPGFKPSELDAIVLTHAHIDHTGYLPLVVRLGYRKPIYCTPATAELLGLLLPDSAHLQEEEARYANKHHSSRHSPAKPLYNSDDVLRTLKLLKPIQRSQSTEFLPGIRVRPECAGHILGSTTLNLELGGRMITFSGDIGRFDSPILPDPVGIPLGDLLLCESTYGDRDHSTEEIRTQLAEAINKAAERDGPIIIPAFAIGRTQNILYHLAELERDGLIPVLPVYVDSPMAVDATKIYRKYRHDYDEDAAALIEDGKTPLLTANTTFCKRVAESKRLNTLKGSRIIVSASGMITGGRILHHMLHWVHKPEATVLFVGYQAEGTRGAEIQRKAETVKIFGEIVRVRAKIETISGLSAHGDRQEILRWLRSCKGSPGSVRVIHGEPRASEAFSATLRGELGWKAQPAQYLETFEID